MNVTRTHGFARRAVIVVAAIALGLGVSARAGDGVYSSGLLELGDGVPPPGMPGMADITANPDQSGPDWAELFDADGSALDAYPLDAEGQPMGNGVPDYQELYGGEWAVFTADYVSMGSEFEGDALTADGRVVNGVVHPDHDLGNAYVYSTFDSTGNLVLFAAAERLGSGDSTLELEFNQDHFRLGHGGFGHNVPWQVLGSRAPGDILVKLTFTGGMLSEVDASVWDGDGWMLLSYVTGESCDPAETLCAICNAESIEGGAWDGQPIEAGRFVEMGVNVGALLPGDQPAFTTVRMRTPQDAGFGYFGEGN